MLSAVSGVGGVVSDVTESDLRAIIDAATHAALPLSTDAAGCQQRARIQVDIADRLVAALLAESDGWTVAGRIWLAAGCPLGECYAEFRAQAAGISSQRPIN